VRVLFHQTVQQVLSDYSISLFQHPHLFHASKRAFSVCNSHLRVVAEFWTVASVAML
jgi:hypothetical protein